MASWPYYGNTEIHHLRNFDANSTKVTEVERTNIQTDERKDENYIPVGINGGGIMNRYCGR